MRGPKGYDILALFEFIVLDFLGYKYLKFFVNVDQLHTLGEPTTTPP